jgi:hypothetical protein
MITFKGSSKENILVELCVENYAMHDGLVNGANGIFQGSIEVFNSQEVIWILFNNPKCGQLTRIKNAHSYEHEIHPTSTLIEPISKDIQIDSKSSHIITRTQISHSIGYNMHYTSNTRINT